VDFFYKKLRATEGRWLRTESLSEKDHTEPHLPTERYAEKILMQITDANFRIYAFILEYFYGAQTNDSHYNRCLMPPAY